MKRRKSKKNNNEDYEDDVFVMELKETSKDVRPVNFTSSQSPDQLISEVRLASFHASNSHITCKEWTLARL